MKYSDKQKEILRNKLSYLKNVKCTSCGGQEWIVNDTMFEMREFHGGSMVIGGGSAVLPLATVSCKQCGNTIFFNAISLGLLNEEDEQRKK